jgi:two-component system sensor histidine kinase RpfC
VANAGNDPGGPIEVIARAVSIAGFSAVIAISPAWEQQLRFGLTFLIVMVVVPMYAAVLLKKLRYARALAEQESQAKSQLLAKVSHELRTPLSGIVASAQLLKGEHTKEGVKKRADTILELSKELMLEINDLLDSAKHKANFLVLESTVFDLSKVMAQIHTALASTAESKGIGFTVTMDEKIRFMVLGDSHYLNRVLMNIAGNAVKFTENGKVDVYAELLEEGADFYQLRFGVRDTGIGIPKHLHESVFDPFFQVSEGAARKYEGTGLGMSIAKDIVTMMKGQMKLESDVGKGSHFYFDLVLPKAASEAKFETSPESNSIVYCKRILVADDNRTNLMLIKELLARDGHEVAIANTGEEALEVLRESSFDLIFLDYNMGNLDGSEVLRQYRSDRPDAAPAYFLTADTTETTSHRLRESGAFGVLHKPITSEGIRQAIVNVFSSEALCVSQDSPATTDSVENIPLADIDLSVIEDLGLISFGSDFLNDVLENAVIDIERICAKLSIALDREDQKQIHQGAHKLKGLSDSVGAARLSAMANMMMKITHSEIGKSKERLRHDISEAKTQCIQDIRNILTSQNGACA